MSALEKLFYLSIQNYIYYLFTMGEEGQQRLDNAIPVPSKNGGFFILVPRASFSFVHFVGDFKTSSTRAEN